MINVKTIEHRLRSFIELAGDVDSYIDGIPTDTGSRILDLERELAFQEYYLLEALIHNLRTRCKINDGYLNRKE